MKILIITGGHINLEFAGNYLAGHSFDHIIAADAGLASCDKMGLCPSDILGDFDSLKNLELREQYRKKGIPVREFPTRKDYTDTHLALLYAMDLWKEKYTASTESEGKSDIASDMASEKKDSPVGIWVFGATGTRFDHSLANIGLMTMLADAGIPCYMIDEHNQMELLKGPVEKSYRKDPDLPYFSLLPFSTEVTGLDLIGFSYPLENATMREFESLGISNELEAAEATLRMQSGYMLVVRSCD